MRNLCMTISYDGTNYSGFQSQLYQRTIQYEIERVLRELTGENIMVISSGRTDAGVHAHAQVINFATSSKMELRRWCLAMNHLLPDDIIAIDVREVPLSFHARQADNRKTYRYTINNYRYVDVLKRHHQYHHPVPLDIDAMQVALPCIIGEHDFTSFCSAKSTKASHVRTIFDARLDIEHLPHRQDPGALIHVIIEGNGFLYHMVRIIVGTLVYIGEGKIQSDDMQHILVAKDRSLAGPTAPAHGLVLEQVLYEAFDV